MHFMQVYIRLDQPMAALEVYRTGLDKFPNEVTFLTGVARIYEAIGNLSLSAKYYKILLVVRMCNMRFPISTGHFGILSGCSLQEERDH